MDVYKIVESVNAITRHAVTHGGDSGGSYEQNEEGLINSLKQFMNEMNLSFDEWEIVEAYHIKDRVFTTWQIINTDMKLLGFYDGIYEFNV